jgi:hypothetical protein
MKRRREKSLEINLIYNLWRFILDSGGSYGPVTVCWEKAFLQLFWLLPVTIIPPIVHILIPFTNLRLSVTVTIGVVFKENTYVCLSVCLSQ